MDTISGILLILIFVFSVVVHEVAHGYAAFRLGDPTAYLQGRLTFNPIRHIDPFWTILMPLAMYYTAGFAFGGAKPVSVNPLHFRDPRRGMMWTGLAGPASNVLLALLATFALFVTLVVGRMVEVMPDLYIRLAGQTIFINLILAGFNMLPIPPLDGSRVLAGIVSREMAQKIYSLERHGFLILIGLLLLPDLGGPDILSLYRRVAVSAANGLIRGAFLFAYWGGD